MTAFVDVALSRLLESAEWRPVLPMLDRIAGSARLQIAGGWAMYAAPNSPMNHAIGLGLDGPVSEAEFDEVEDFYRSRDCVSEIVVSPYAGMSLPALLGARGYTVTEWNSVMMRPIDPDESFDTRGIDVRRVAAAGAMDLARVVARGFGENVSPEIFLPIVELPDSLCFLAYLDGNPAGGACGSAFPEPGIAPLYGAATLPEFRNRGVQHALFQARLEAAQNAGCTLAAVSTWPGSVSQRNAERNGFRTAYTKAVMQRRF